MVLEDIEVERLKALKHCTFVPGTNPKRFVRDTQPDMELSERQRHYINILAYKFRRQMPSRLVPDKKPDDLPPKPKPEKKKDVCKKCGVVFEEHHHFVRCAADDCPEKSGKSLLDMLGEACDR